MLQPDIQRSGVSLRFTANVGENAQFYTMANFYKTDTFASFTPQGFNGTPPPPRPATLAAYNVILPVYVCSQAWARPNGVDTGCDATNGTLNPHNPFAAGGQTAQVLLRSPYGRNSRDQFARGSRGGRYRWQLRRRLALLGQLHDLRNRPAARPGQLPDPATDHGRGRPWHVQFHRIPYATPQEVWDYIAPENSRYSPSRLWQAQGTIAKDLFELPGGAMQAALGASYREESIDAPSGNPANDFRAVHPLLLDQRRRYLRQPRREVGLLRAQRARVQAARADGVGPVRRILHRPVQLLAEVRIQVHADRADRHSRHFLEGLPHSELQRIVRPADHRLRGAHTVELRAAFAALLRCAWRQCLCDAAIRAGPDADRQSRARPGKVDLVHRRPRVRADVQLELHARLLEHRGEEPDHRRHRYVGG